MDLSKKLGVKWEDRYDVILPLEVRHKFIEELKEPFKKRGTERERLIKQHPKLIDEKGEITDKLVITNNKYINGHIIFEGYDEKGVYSVFQANNSADNKKWKRIESLSEKLSLLAKYQRDLLRSDITFSEIEDTEKQIDILFIEIFNFDITTIQENPYPKLFKQTKVFFHFKEYIGKHIVENYVDYSYLFQRMLKEELIYSIKHLDFIKWLHEEKFITEKYYNEFTEKGGFRSLKKSSSTQRENNYNNIFH